MYTDPYVTKDLPGPNHYNIPLDNFARDKKAYSISQKLEKPNV